MWRALGTHPTFSVPVQRSAMNVGTKDIGSLKGSRQWFPLAIILLGSRKTRQEHAWWSDLALLFSYTDSSPQKMPLEPLMTRQESSPLTRAVSQISLPALYISLVIISFLPSSTQVGWQNFARTLPCPQLSSNPFLLNATPWCLVHSRLFVEVARMYAGHGTKVRC